MIGIQEMVTNSLAWSPMYSQLSKEKKGPWILNLKIALALFTHDLHARRN